VSANIFKELRVNRQIRAREVRLIGEESEQMGVIPIDKALQIARDRNLDLVEVASTAVPPVCRLLDYGKYRYEQTKKDRKARVSQKGGALKEIRIRPRVQDHDLDTKINKAKKFFADGDKVRFFVIFRGREITHPELGVKALQKVTGDLKDVAVLDGKPSLEGRIMSVVLSPVSAKKAVKEQPADVKVNEEKVKEEV
jgi:translation initiation factor IF-3